MFVKKVWLITCLQNSNCRVNPKKLGSIQKKLEAFCAQDQDKKQWAQKVGNDKLNEALLYLLHSSSP